MVKVNVSSLAGGQWERALGTRRLPAAKSGLAC